MKTSSVAFVTAPHISSLKRERVGFPFAIRSRTWECVAEVVGIKSPASIKFKYPAWLTLSVSVSLPGSGVSVGQCLIHPRVISFFRPSTYDSNPLASPTTDTVTSDMDGLGCSCDGANAATDNSVKTRAQMRLPKMASFMARLYSSRAVFGAFFARFFFGPVACFPGLGMSAVGFTFLSSSLKSGGT